MILFCIVDFGYWMVFFDIFIVTFIFICVCGVFLSDHCIVLEFLDGMVEEVR